MQHLLTPNKDCFGTWQLEKGQGLWVQWDSEGEVGEQK